MIVDRETWMLIKEMYERSWGWYDRVVYLLLLFFPYISVFLIIAYFLMDRWKVVIYHYVCHQVNDAIMNGNNKAMKDYMLQFETSPLPGRHGRMSYRYQLVRKLGKEEVSISEMDDQITDDDSMIDWADMSIPLVPSSKIPPYRFYLPFFLHWVQNFPIFCSVSPTSQKKVMEEDEEIAALTCYNEMESSNDEANTNTNTNTDIAEWRIFCATPCMNENYSSSDCRNSEFRNPSTGLSLIPSQTYTEFLQDLKHINNVFWRNFVLSLIGTQWWMIPCAMIGEESTWFVFIVFAMMVIMSFSSFSFMILFICKKSRHDSLMKLINDHRKVFLECGVEIGYADETGDSKVGKCITLRRKRNENSSAECSNIPKEYPPIFLKCLVPGDIHIQEKEYDPTMIVDRETWMLIKEMYNRGWELYDCAMCLCVLLFCYFLVFLIPEGTAEDWLGVLAVVIFFIVTYFLMDRWKVEIYHNVCHQVNYAIMNGNNEAMKDYMLQFETSPLPDRRGRMSYRYQLVRKLGKEDDSISEMEDQITDDDSMIDWADMSIPLVPSFKIYLDQIFSSFCLQRVQNTSVPSKHTLPYDEQDNYNNYRLLHD